ncbi:MULTISPECIES: DUF3558 domain-containing protein [Nocardiaceae]|uniref:DUF3558 domain-containing protein n=1 Tax=Rhodococcoides corynebacterioides TaxID=53972 RepID=A0ABS2KVV0_9NOCA|nr:MULTISPECIES: DUF3558 domain-containing protein [Rhodococcus]MBM7416072.1 hypothetical protein [Rhodococcus corynebacterioides]MBP1114325.1 hypothetical protein [Rhodococcus sp. PvP016]
MNSVRWAGVAAIVLLGLAGCGSDSDAATDDAPSTSASQEPGPFFGVCGGLSDEEVRTAFAVPSFAIVTRNSVGCEWEVSGPTGPSVSFSWYRGSPIGRERSGAELIGRPAEDIEIDGRSGFRSTGLNALGEVYLCEVGLQFGADFVHFSVMYADSAPTADPCAVATDLTTLVAERAS